MEILKERSRSLLKKCRDQDMNKNAFFKNTLGLVILTLLGRFIGFLREITLSYIYGSSEMSDAYVVANSISTILFNGLFFGIMTAYIPLTYECKTNEEVDKFTSNVINIVATIVLIGIALLMIFLEPVISVFAIGFTEKAMRYTLEIARYAVLTIVFIMIINMTNGYLNTKSEFRFSGIYPIISNIIMCIVFVITKDSPPLLGIGYFFSIALPAIWGIVLLKKKNYKYSFFIDLHDEKVRSLMKAAIPAFVGTSVIQLNVMIDRMFASTLSSGTVSALNYADLLSSFAVQVFATSIATVTFPILSQMAAEKKYEAYKDLLENRITIIVVISVFLSGLIIPLSQNIVKLLFFRGAFDLQALIVTSDALMLYAPGIIGTSLNQILYKAFFAKRDTVTPFVCYGIGIVINIVLNFLFISKYQHKGLALATSISVLFIAILQLLAINHKLIKLGIQKIMIVCLKAGISGVAMIVCVHNMNIFLEKYLAQNSILMDALKLVFLAVTSLLIYCSMCILLKIEELKEIWYLINEKIRK